MVTLSFTIFSGQKNYNRAHMLFQVLCGLEPIFYTTHPNEEPENMALAESLNSSAEEMRAKKIPDSYAEKYNKEEPKDSAYLSNLVDSLFKESAAQEEKTLKVSEHMEKKPKRVEKKIIDIDDDNFELDL